MLKLTRMPISYANVTATLALVFAMSGGALAANHYLINSTSQISPKVLKKLRGGTGKTGHTGLQGNLGATGKEGAPGKEGAAGKEGVSGLVRWRTTVATAGKSEEEAATVTLATVGPFTVTGHCYEQATNTRAATYIRTSEDGSYAESYSIREISEPLNIEEGDVQISEKVAEGETAEHKAAFFGPNDGSWAAESHDGSVTLDGFSNQGVWLGGASGPACSFSGYLVIE